VASRLRQFKQLSGLKIVAVTGYASPADLQRCKEVGIDEHFAKPVDPELVRSYLARFGTAAKRTSQEVHHQDVP
jgi:CheY-like chemotaxis protein